MSTSLAIDSTGDLEIIEGKLRLVSDNEYTRQKLQIRLSFVKGDWFLDLDIGIPYYEEIFKKSTPQTRRDDIFKEAILGTEGVASLSQYESTIDPLTRKMSISFVATSTNGEDLSFVETFIIGAP